VSLVSQSHCLCKTLRAFYRSKAQTLHACGRLQLYAAWGCLRLAVQVNCGLFVLLVLSVTCCHLRDVFKDAPMSTRTMQIVWKFFVYLGQFEDRPFRYTCDMNSSSVATPAF
jgi:hypothetical protein